MQIVFMVAEKPSLAESISKTLSRGRSVSRRTSGGPCHLHEWTDSFMNEQVRFKMTSVCGHVMTTDFPSRYNNWDRVDPGRGAGTLILWLDCDKEGENICFEVIDCVENVMVGSKRILRAQFSAVTEQELTHAMRNLRSPNKNEALSVDARQELDLRIGCAFTRFQTKFFQGKYGDLNSNLVSYGPCQTPTLGFCVKRHSRIQSFKPESFWRLKVSVRAENGLDLDLMWNRDRLFDKEAAMLFLNRIKSCTSASVIKVTSKEKVKPRPQGLNTVEMLRTASSGLGIGPHATMAIAERLYISGYINYPRTETTTYPSTFDLRSLVEHQARHPVWGDSARELLRTGLTAPRKGQDAGDHPPIAPMRMATASELGHDANILYEFIAQHFLATVSPDCRYESTQALVSVGDEELFTLTGTRVLDPGFTKILVRQAVEEKPLPTFLVPGAQLPLAHEPILIEGQTGPPDYLTESELITAMERHGIGTDASIPTHIENIVQRGYVELISGRRLQPTNLGIVLVNGYQTIDPELVLPHMRRAVEEELNRIAKGQAEFSQVVQFVLAIFAAKYRFFIEHIQGMDQLFEVTFTSLSETGRPLSRCGKCHRFMRLIDSKPQRLHCSICTETYSVPQNGTIRLYKEKRCPLDDFEVLLWTQGTKGKSMVFCPYCFSHPAFEDMPKAAGCQRCPHPSCPQSLETRSIDACPECADGLLLLDDSIAPKYRLCCNRCPVILIVSDIVKHISIGQESCKKCSAMHLNLKVDPTKFTSGAGDAAKTNYSECAFCSDTLCRLFELVQSRPTGPPMGRHNGSRPMGRGRGGGRSRPRRR